MKNIYYFCLLLLLVSWELAESIGESKQPNIYKWLAQNSYICDPSLTNHQSPKFLPFHEASNLRCSCGNPLVSKTACARRALKEKPKCMRLPEACMQEYTVIFASAGNRMLKPLKAHHPATHGHKKPHQHNHRHHHQNKHKNQKKRIKIVSTQKFSTSLIIKKPL